MQVDSRTAPAGAFGHRDVDASGTSPKAPKGCRTFMTQECMWSTAENRRKPSPPLPHLRSTHRIDPVMDAMQATGLAAVFDCFSAHAEGEQLLASDNPVLPLYQVPKLAPGQSGFFRTHDLDKGPIGKIRPPKGGGNDASQVTIRRAR